MQGRRTWLPRLHVIRYIIIVFVKDAYVGVFRAQVPAKCAP